MLILDNVGIAYGENEVLSDIDLTFTKGKIHAVIGKSGVGKSTLLHALAGIKPFTGRIMLDEEALDRCLHRIALVPQKNSLIPWKTAMRNICLPAALRGIPDSVLRGKLDKLSGELGISDLLKKYPNHLSGGEQQRVTIARALLYDPELLLLDEAFSALDAITKSEAQHIFSNAISKRNVTTIIVTHEIDEALYLAEEIYVMKDGNCTKAVGQNSLFGREKELFPSEYNEMTQLLKEML